MFIPIWALAIVVIAAIVVILAISFARRDGAAIIGALEDSVKKAKDQRDHQTERAVALVAEVETLRTQVTSVLERVEKAELKARLNGEEAERHHANEVKAISDGLATATLLKAATKDRDDKAAELAESKRQADGLAQEATNLLKIKLDNDADIKQLRSDLGDRDSKIRQLNEKKKTLNGALAAAKPRKKKA